ncbi:lipase member K-like isoform X2 [Erythrolamprus reginae]|uniref:lipase member K-like isoform X2 n=1 Tax=Erythrolamprus reginae TaxID=121349 RepID=UPI00396D017F
MPILPQAPRLRFPARRPSCREHPGFASPPHARLAGCTPASLPHPAHVLSLAARLRFPARYPSCCKCLGIASLPSARPAASSPASLKAGPSKQLIFSGKPNMWLVLILLYWPVLVEGNILNLNINPEARLNSKQLIQYWKYPFEEYYVVTVDGYILDIFRIPHGRENNKTTSPKQVVFLQHGLLVEAGQWYQNLPHNSLAFMLADAGYDVWLGNSRGNTWSKNHTSLSPLSENFWKFSFDQMAKYDLPASIDFVLQKTGQQQLYYIGHSQGTTIAFIAFSSNQQLASKIKLYIALAPVAAPKNAKTPIAKFAKLSDTEIKILFGQEEFLPKTHISTLLSTKLCSQKTLVSICSNILFILSGFNEENLNMAINSGKLQAYDHGRLGNKFHYGQDSPPEYNVSAMTVPTAIWNGGNDWISDPEDVNQLITQTRNLISHKFISEWNHLDFIYGIDAPDKLYYDIMDLLQRNF